jgi:hypothetical protein
MKSTIYAVSALARGQNPEIAIITAIIQRHRGFMA